MGSHNLRDHMTEAELIFTALAELSTRQIAETMAATGLPENTNAAKAGGGIAGMRDTHVPIEGIRVAILKSPPCYALYVL